MNTDWLAQQAQNHYKNDLLAQGDYHYSTVGCMIHSAIVENLLPENTELYNGHALAKLAKVPPSIICIAGLIYAHLPTQESKNFHRDFWTGLNPGQISKELHHKLLARLCVHPIYGLHLHKDRPEIAKVAEMYLQPYNTYSQDQWRETEKIIRPRDREDNIGCIGYLAAWASCEKLSERTPFIDWEALRDQAAWGAMHRIAYAYRCESEEPDDMTSYYQGTHPTSSYWQEIRDIFLSNTR